MSDPFRRTKMKGIDMKNEGRSRALLGIASVGRAALLLLGLLAMLVLVSVMAVLVPVVLTATAFPAIAAWQKRYPIARRHRGSSSEPSAPRGAAASQGQQKP